MANVMIWTDKGGNVQVMIDGHQVRDVKGFVARHDAGKRELTIAMDVDSLEVDGQARVMADEPGDLISRADIRNRIIGMGAPESEYVRVALLQIDQAPAVELRSIPEMIAGPGGWEERTKPLTGEDWMREALALRSELARMRGAGAP